MLTLAKEPLNDPLISSQIKQFLNLNSMLRSRPSHLQIFSLLNFVFTVNPEWSCQNRYNHLQCFTLDYTWFFSPMSVHNLVYLGGVSRHYLQLVCISFKWFIHNVDTLHINIGGSQHKPLNANLNDLDRIHQQVQYLTMMEYRLHMEEFIEYLCLFSRQYFCKTSGVGLCQIHI